MTGAELKARRKELGLSQQAFANLLGVARNTVSRWEIGKPMNEQTVRLAFEVIARRRQVEALTATPASARRAR